MAKTEILDAAKKRLAELDAERVDLLRMIAASGEAAPVAWPHPFPDPLVVPLPFIQPAPHPMTPWVLRGHGGLCACPQCCPLTTTLTSASGSIVAEDLTATMGIFSRALTSQFSLDSIDLYTASSSGIH